MASADQSSQRQHCQDICRVANLLPNAGVAREKGLTADHCGRARVAWAADWEPLHG